jgi:hypothetical protein
MRHKQDEPIGIMPDGSIAVFDTEEAARIVGEAHERAMRTNKPEDWAAWRAALERHRWRPVAEQA